MSNGILFLLNSPIESKNEDIIGFGAQVKRLAAAIDSDSQMIAVTSPFGSGKTSLVELLQEERRKAKKESCILKRVFCVRERIVKISIYFVITIHMFLHMSFFLVRIVLSCRKTSLIMQ